MDNPPLAPTPAREPGANIKQREQGLVGRVIEGRYRVEELIAKGGMGAVYRGYHRYLKKRVAVKVLQPDMDHLPDLVARFEREAVAGAHVAHPNVAAATDFGKLDDGSRFLVVEYVRGVTLSELLRRGPLPAHRAARIARQLASALDAVHTMGIVHRDVKSRNVIVSTDEDDLTKLIDFGLAKVPVEHLGPVNSRRSRLDSIPQRITGTGEIFGTVAYLAPEAAFGMDEVDGRSDLFALGVVFYEMLAGRRPFAATDPGELFAEQRRGPPRLADVAPKTLVPSDIEDVVRKLLARDPADRFQRGADVVAAIDAAMSAVPVPPSTPTAMAQARPVDASIELPLQSTGLPAIAAIALAIAAVVAVVQIAGGSREPAKIVAAAPPVIAAPVVTASAAAPAVLADPGLRRDLVRAARARDQRAAHRALVALVDRDAGALRETEIAIAARDVAGGVPADGSGDDALEALALRGGSAGLDVLYGLVERRGGSRVAARAAALLRRPEVIASASPQLAIAFAVREAPCPEKPALFERAAREGDARALLSLETAGRACFTRNQQLELAILTLRARLGQR